MLYYGSSKYDDSAQHVSSLEHVERDVYTTSKVVDREDRAITRWRCMKCDVVVTTYSAAMTAIFRTCKKQAKRARAINAALPSLCADIRAMVCAYDDLRTVYRAKARADLIEPIHVLGTDREIECIQYSVNSANKLVITLHGDDAHTMDAEVFWDITVANNNWQPLITALKAMNIKYPYVAAMSIICAIIRDV